MCEKYSKRDERKTQAAADVTIFGAEYTGYQHRNGIAKRQKLEHEFTDRALLIGFQESLVANVKEAICSDSTPDPQFQPMKH